MAGMEEPSLTSRLAQSALAACRDPPSFLLLWTTTPSLRHAWDSRHTVKCPMAVTVLACNSLGRAAGTVQAAPGPAPGRRLRREARATRASPSRLTARPGTPTQRRSTAGTDPVPAPSTGPRRRPSATCAKAGAAATAPRRTSR
eukprot:767267-Hanusia_phi.AAC.5